MNKRSSLLIAGTILVVLAGIFFVSRIPDYLFILKYHKREHFWDVYATYKENRAFIKDNPNNDSAYYSLGQGFYGLGDFDKAIEAFKKAAEIAPEKGHYWTFLGRTYQIKKDYPRASAAYTKTIEADHTRPDNYTTLAWLYYFRLKPEKDKAFDVLKQGLSYFPDDKEILFDITRYYIYDRNEAFRPYAKHYLKIDPSQILIKNAYENGLPSP